MDKSSEKYRTYIVRSWNWYQRVTASKDHTILKYNESCQKDADNLYGKHVMVLRDNISNIKGFYYYSNGFPMENIAETDGYIDVRTNKKYANIHLIFADIR